MEKRNSSREGSTHLVHLKKNKSVFYVFQLQTEKGDGALEAQVLQQPSTVREAPAHILWLQSPNNKKIQPSHSDEILSISVEQYPNILLLPLLLWTETFKSGWH